MKHSALPASVLPLLLHIALACPAPLAAAAAGQPAPSTHGPPYWTYRDFLEGKIPREFTVRKGHPRLLITPENKQDIIAKAKAAPKLFQDIIRREMDDGTYRRYDPRKKRRFNKQNAES